MPVRYDKSPLVRKLRYLHNMASPDGVLIAHYRWKSIWDLLRLSDSFNILFRFLLDMYLNLSLHLDFEQFDWHKFDFLKNILKYKVPMKAQYDISKYDKSVYDPVELTDSELERLVWDARYKHTKKDIPEPNVRGEAFLKHLENFVQMLMNKGCREDYVKALIEIIPIVEAKIRDDSRVGFAIVGLSKVVKTGSPFTEITVRSIQDFKTPVKCKAYTVYEHYVGFARVGYARVSHEFLRPTKETSDYLEETIKKFHSWTEPTWQATFWLYRIDRMHIKGGGHQIKLGYITKVVREVLDKHGVVHFMRGAYYSFAREYVYLMHMGHRRFKTYKVKITDDDLIAKYKRMGCDESILREIICRLRALKV